MDNMFWEIPTSQIFQSLEWAIKRAKLRGNPLYFGAKGGMRHFHWLGKSSIKEYTIFTCKEVMDFVQFDIYSCNLLALGPLIL